MTQKKNCCTNFFFPYPKSRETRIQTTISESKIPRIHVSRCDRRNYQQTTELTLVMHKCLRYGVRQCARAWLICCLSLFLLFVDSVLSYFRCTNVTLTTTLKRQTLLCSVHEHVLNYIYMHTLSIVSYECIQVNVHRLSSVYARALCAYPLYVYENIIVFFLFTIVASFDVVCVRFMY